MFFNFYVLSLSTHTRACAHIHTHTHKRAHTHTHTHTHINTHTHTHTHIYIYIYINRFRVKQRDAWVCVCLCLCVSCVCVNDWRVLAFCLDVCLCTEIELKKNILKSWDMHPCTYIYMSFFLCVHACVFLDWVRIFLYTYCMDRM